MFEKNNIALLGSVAAGFPSPADDYLESLIDLNDLLVTNKPATFFLKVDGDSMIGAGIFAGDLLVVDRSLAPSFGRVVVACLDGEFTVKRLIKQKNRVFLCAENKKYKPIDVTNSESFFVWGVVSSVIHKV